MFNPFSQCVQLIVCLFKQKYPKYTLTVKAADMKGNGLESRAKVILTVTDSNDHAPAFTETSVSTTHL